MRTYTRMAWLLIFSAITLTFFTCGSRDHGTESKEEGTIMGSWRLVRVVLKDTPVGDLTMSAQVFLEMSETGATTSTLRFNEDGTALLITTYEDGSVEEVPGTWTINGSQMTLNGAGIDDTIPYHISGDTLTLTIILPIDFDSDGVSEDTAIDMIYNRI